jgi:hypothetical protein
MPDRPDEPLMASPTTPDAPEPITAHVRYAYQLRQGARSNGGDHIVLDAPLRSARLRREAGDALCNPRAASATCPPAVRPARVRPRALHVSAAPSSTASWSCRGTTCSGAGAGRLRA